MNPDRRLCAVVPTYDNPKTVGSVVEVIRACGLDVVLVDDGSGPEGRRTCEAIGESGEAHVRRLPKNRGKGAAVQAGFELARELGYTHVLQVDADGQHDLGQIPQFVEVSHESPEALILAYPEYDESAPRARVVGRRFTNFWVDLEVGKGRIRDAMIGFRVYPLAAVARLGRLGVGMDFDIEIAVRLVQAGTEVVNLPMKVRYPSPEEGGVSHFRPFVDNLRFAWLHSRLCTAASFRWLGRLLTGGRR